MRKNSLVIAGVMAVLLTAGASLATAQGAVGAGPAPGARAGVHAARVLAETDPMAEELNIGNLVVTIIIFVGLFVVVSKAGWKPIMAGLKGREQAIRESIEAAAKAKADAEKSTRELEARIAEAQRSAAQQLAQAKADAMKVAETIRQQAESESAALKDRTVREIDAAKQQALAEINSHAAELGTSVARKILQRDVTSDDQQRLVEESLAELAKKN